MIGLLSAALLAAAPPVGFIWHFPFVRQGDAAVAATGVSAMTCRAPWGVIEPEPGRFEYGQLAEQLLVARDGGFRLILILECNPFCAPSWLRAQAAARGEQVVGADGRPNGEPSARSPAYLAALDRFLRGVTGWLEANDRPHTVVAYHPGIEWWFPPEFRHGAIELAQFRAWLSDRYGDIAALNGAWHTSFETFDTVRPPAVTFPDLFRRGREGLAEPGLAEPWPGELAQASRDWHEYWVGAAVATIDDLARRVQTLDPGRETISFQTFAWAAAGEWDYLGWCACAPDELARATRHLDALGLQLPISWGDPHQVTVGLDLVRKYGRPVHALDLLDFTQGQAAGYEVMRRGTLAAVAHGATAINYCSWAGAGDYSFVPAWPPAELERLVAVARRALATADGLRPEAEAAMVVPYWYPGCQNRAASFVGFYRLLQSLQVTVDLVSLGDLEAGAVDLSRYRFVLVPDAPQMPPPAVAALGRARRLLTTERCGGMASASRREIPDYGEALSAPLRRDSQAGDGPPMLDFRAEDPARRAALAESLRDALRAAGVEPMVGGVPPRVACTTLRGEDDWAIWLVNGGPSPCAAGPVVVAGRDAGEVRAWADGRPAPVRLRAAGGGVVMALPPFEADCLVRVQPPSVRRRPGSRRTASRVARPYQNEAR